MKAYRYMAYTQAGRRRSGTLVAETERDASDQLRAQDLFVAELSETGSQQPGSGKASGNRADRVALLRGWRHRMTPDLQVVFTLTNVSAADFGEGSFDKGFRFRIPLAWMLGKPNRRGFGLTIRPTQRDGGQRVAVPGRLYGSIREAHRIRLKDQRVRFWE